MSSTQLTCSHCGAALCEDDIDPGRRRATCRFCGAVVAVPLDAEPAADAAAPLKAESPAVSPKVPRSESIHYVDSMPRNLIA